MVTASNYRPVSNTAISYHRLPNVLLAAALCCIDLMSGNRAAILPATHLTANTRLVLSPGMLAPGHTVLGKTNLIAPQAPTDDCGGGTLTANTTWSAGHVITCPTVVVPSGVVLTVLAGTVVKLGMGGGFFVEGTLNVMGTGANPAVFTSLKDDAYGGDTNGDGGTTQPATEDWAGIYVSDSGTASLTSVLIRFAAATSSAGSLEVSNSIFYKTTIGITSLPLAKTLITNNRFVDIATWPIVAAGPLNGLNFVIANNTVVGGAVKSIHLSSPVVNQTVELFPNEGMPYYCDSYHGLIVPAGQKLAVAPGAVFKDCGIDVQGVLDVRGTNTNPVVFTSFTDDSYGGDTNGDGATTLPKPGDWDGVDIENSGLATVTNALFRFGGRWGGGVLNSELGGKLSVTNSIFERNRLGIVAFGPNAVIANNDFVGNDWAVAASGVGNTITATINAVNNWWGSPTGPYNSKTNPSGTGDAVDEHVLFSPWLTHSATRPFDDAALDNQSDYLTVAPGQSVSIHVAVKNTGTTTWDGTTYRWSGRGVWQGQSSALGVSVAPSATLVIRDATFNAPTQPGQYDYGFMLLNAAGTEFGPYFFVRVTAVQPTQTSTPTASPAPVTPTPTPTTNPNPTSTPVVAAPKVAVLVHGWQGIPYFSQPFSCAEGYSLYTRGNSNNKDDFGKIAELLDSNGYKVYFVHYNTTSKGTDRIEDSANCIRTQIDQIRKDVPGFGKMTLIAHSMGGLVSRVYLDANNGANWQYADHLITVGSPHAGLNSIYLAKLVALKNPNVHSLSNKYCTSDPGTCQLDTREVAKLNAAYPLTSPHDYRFISGSAENANLLGKLSSFFASATEGDNDGIIGQASADALFGRSSDNSLIPVLFPNQHIERFNTGATHINFWGESYFNLKASVCRIKSILSLTTDPAGLSCSTRVNAPEASAQQTPDTTTATSATDFLPSITGTLTTLNNTAQFDIVLDGSQAGLLLSWDSGDVTMTLTSPSGIAINKNNVATLISNSVYAETTLTEGIASIGYLLPNVQPGIWHVNLSSAQVLTQSNYVLVGAVASPITLTVTSAAAVASGQPLVIQAHLQASGAPIGNASLQLLAEDVIAPLGAWAALGNGNYAITVTTPLTPGQYLVLVNAAVAQPAPFRRQGAVMFEVFAPKITQPAAATLLPLDLDGKFGFDTLRLTAPLAITAPGDYGIQITLKASDGTPITQSQWVQNFGVGNINLTTDFSGDGIRQRGLNGPYQAEMTLVFAPDLTTAFSKSPVAISANLSANQFGGTHKVYLPLARR